MIYWPESIYVRHVLLLLVTLLTSGVMTCSSAVVLPVSWPLKLVDSTNYIRILIYNLFLPNIVVAYLHMPSGEQHLIFMNLGFGSTVRHPRQIFCGGRQMELSLQMGRISDQDQITPPIYIFRR